MNDRHTKKHKRSEYSGDQKKDRRRSSSSASSSESDKWVEKETTMKTSVAKREDWMSMTSMLKTYSREDVKPKREAKEKKHIDSYNPATSSRELNPYWKDGGTGVPLTPESFRKSKPFIKPSDEDDYYSRSSSSKEYKTKEKDKRYEIHHDDRKARNSYDNNDTYYSKSCNWKRESENTKRQLKYEETGSYNWKKESDNTKRQSRVVESESVESPISKPEKQQESKYLSDEKMNKLAAKLVKAEIMGDTKLVEELKAKLEAAREYRKQNPNAGEDDDDDNRVMLMSANSAGSYRPLTQGGAGDPRSKGGKRKAETHSSGQRTKYFGNDDKYDLTQMFQEEKYGNNHNDEAQLAKIAAKHINPNDDLEDIFVDEISKTRNEAKDKDREKQRAINQHVKMERSLEGCEFCLDSKNMLKHLMVSCGSKVYLAVPAKTSLVKGHCIITTIQHSTCVTSIDEDVWEEIMNYRKALTQFFNSQNKDVVFFETATKLHRFPHMVINCVPMARDVGDMAAIYFKKAILECEAEWSMNKKVIELKGKNIRKGVPKGLPYFWIDFGMDPGFAHVIEDQQLFPKSFAEEIIAGILDLDHHTWKNPKREYGDLQRKKVLDFIKEWKPFDTVSKGTV